MIVIILWDIIQQKGLWSLRVKILHTTTETYLHNNITIYKTCLQHVVVCRIKSSRHFVKFFRFWEDHRLFVNFLTSLCKCDQSNTRWCRVFWVFCFSTLNVYNWKCWWPFFTKPSGIIAQCGCNKTCLIWLIHSGP